jgi:LL-diaminopimelate aminotransferase
MSKVNENFLKVSESYLFVEVARRIRAYQEAHPEAQIIKMGIGDVTRPIVPAVIDALHKAVDEMGTPEGFHGYGPEQGYAFLRETILRHDYTDRGLTHLEADEIFISDGAKSDTGNIGDILGQDNTVAVTDPVYPVYVDTNVMGGRAGDFLDGRYSKITYLPCTRENHFVPALPDHPVDIIYLCFPNNPTGTTLTRDQLKVWVDYALENDSLILFDAAYEAFITEPDVPHSIYEIPGAERCAIEFRSLSKTAGFTGLRCGYTVVPKTVTARKADGTRVPLNKLWNRRQSTKFNRTAYIIQRAAEAVFSPEGQQQITANIEYYRANATLMKETFAAIGIEAFGGVNSPYVWIKTPKGLGSWEFFDRLLDECHVVGTPGVGFGPSGEGYFRLTAFATHEATVEAMQRIRNWKI